MMALHFHFLESDGFARYAVHVMPEPDFPSSLPELEHQEVLLLARNRTRDALPALNNPSSPDEIVTQVVQKVVEIVKNDKRPRRYPRWMRETMVAVARREAQRLVDEELTRRKQNSGN